MRERVRVGPPAYKNQHHQYLVSLYLVGLKIFVPGTVFVSLPDCNVSWQGR